MVAKQIFPIINRKMMYTVKTTLDAGKIYKPSDSPYILVLCKAKKRKVKFLPKISL